mgnify:CR=1 FL=1
MTRFTDSPYERMMTRRPEAGRKLPVLSLYPKATPVMAAGIMGSPDVGVCHREMERWLKERKRKNEYSDYIYQAACGF